jgi:hypothetical protein
MHLDGWTWEEMAVERNVTMQMRMPTLATTNSIPFLARAGGLSPETKRRYEERLKLISDFFEQARAYQKRRAAAGVGFALDRRLEAMLPILEGRESLMVFCAEGAGRERRIGLRRQGESEDSAGGRARSGAARLAESINKGIK